ncbi:MAG: DUF1552 domain-containing protein [Myxococcota bacterium]|nr:DUF1552 domain-containing protein [Myxococcota bacterium]
MNRGQLNRRRFLQLVGASAMTYPFLRSLPSFAATSNDPPFLILLFTPNGVVRHLWGAVGPKPAGTAAAVTTPLVFRPTLAPLESVKDQVIVFEGLSVTAAKASHESGMAALWTGQTSSGAPATSPSVDQAIASKQSLSRPYGAVSLMVRSSVDFVGREVKTRMLYSPSGGFVDPYDDPVAARNALFPGVPASMAAAGPDKKTFIRQKVFGHLNSELTSMQPRLCTEDRHQLQNMQQAWNDLDGQLAKAATAAASCSVPPAAPAGYSSPSLDFPTSAKLQMDILALALACDLTRVASLQFSTSTSQVTHTWLDATQNDTHHNLSHRGPHSLYELGTDPYNPAPWVVAEYAPQLAGIDLWYAQQVAYLATRLSQLTVGGKGLLSQSVICWGNELDLGAAHNHEDTPFVLIGGGGGKLKTGQLVQFPMKLDADPTTSGIKNRAHNDLLLTLAQVAEAPMTTFGDPQYCTGPITEILA